MSGLNFTINIASKGGNSKDFQNKKKQRLGLKEKQEQNKKQTLPGRHAARTPASFVLCSKFFLF